MLETIPQQSFQLENTPQTPQQSYNCRHITSGFPYTPTSPSPLGFRNGNAQAALSPVMSEREKNSEGFQDQENFSSPIFNGLQSDNNNSNKPFSFTPTYNIITPPNRRSTYEERFRKSGGSSNAYSRIFAGSPSRRSNTPNNSTSSSSSKHRQLFLNRVKQSRDDARFGSRGESLMMMEYHSEQQSWDEQMRRRADTLSQQYHIEDGEILNEENDNNYDGSDGNEGVMLDPDQSALEEFIMQEEGVDPAFMETDFNGYNHLHSPAKSARSDESMFGGDNGDYDDIFMELVD